MARSIARPAPRGAKPGVGNFSSSGSLAGYGIDVQCVATSLVRADSGQIDGASAILVPLIKTQPGELSLRVEMVYRTSCKSALRW